MANPQPSDITVELLGTYGGDITHALSAWTSTKRDLTEEKRARIPQLLKILAHRDTSNWREPRHTSPFEKSVLHFLVRADKATHIHIIKHRIAVSVNAESARYKELHGDDYLYPDDWPTAAEAERSSHAAFLRETYHSTVKNAVHGYHLLVEAFVNWKVNQHMGSREAQPNVSDEAWQKLQEDVRKKVRSRAKETARFVLPHASMITQDVSFNFLSFTHFLHLRADKHAQREVRIVAALMMREVCVASQDFDASFDAFGWTKEARQALYTELGI